MKKILFLMSLLLMALAQSGMAFELNQKTEKTAPVANDIIGIEDSADSYKVKHIKAKNLPISTATQTALDAKSNTATTYTKTDVDTALALKRDKAAIACASGFVLQGITINGTAECIAASSASFPTGTEGQIISYDINGDPVASTVRELAFSDTDFNETVSGTTTTISLASAGGGTISLTESATDPAYSSMTTGQMIVSKSSGDLFYKSATGGYTFAGVYVVDPATYSLTFTLSGVSGADKLTINGTDYTAGTTITGLSGDVAVTGTLGNSTALSCTGDGISGEGLSYLASMTAARSMACEFSTVAVTPETVGISTSGVTKINVDATQQTFCKVNGVPTRNGTLESLEASMESGTRFARLALYTHNSSTNKPDTLVAGSDTGVYQYTAGANGAIVSFPVLGSPLTVAGATYWIAFARGSYTYPYGTATGGECVYVSGVGIDDGWGVDWDVVYTSGIYTATYNPSLAFTH